MSKYTTRRLEKFNKTGSTDVKIGNEKPHSARIIAKISIAIY